MEKLTDNAKLTKRHAIHEAPALHGVLISRKKLFRLVAL